MPAYTTRDVYYIYIARAQSNTILPLLHKTVVKRKVYGLFLIKFCAMAKVDKYDNITPLPAPLHPIKKKLPYHADTIVITCNKGASQRC